MSIVRTEILGIDADENRSVEWDCSPLALGIHNSNFCLAHAPIFFTTIKLSLPNFSPLKFTLKTHPLKCPGNVKCVEKYRKRKN